MAEAEKEAEKADESEKLELKLCTDAYDAVVAAAFNGVRLRFPSDTDGSELSIRLHPTVILLFFCVPLFYVQLSCLSCLVLDMDMKNIWDGATWEGFDESPRRQMMVVIRSMMVVVLQLIGLKEMIGALKPLLFVCNPITWKEIHRPGLLGGSSRWDAKLYSAWLMAPVCVIAQAMQLGIAYYVLVVSMSIIIEANNVKEVIFNGLVVTFLADLDEFMWVAAAYVFHMDTKWFEDFEFKIASYYHEADETKVYVDKERDKARESGWRIWFYRGKGGKVSVLESVVIYSGMIYIYIRQLFMFVQAMHTGILPVARDACEWYRASEGKVAERSFISMMKLRFVDFFTLINYREMLTVTIEKSGLDERCFDDDYKEGPFDRAWEFITWWPQTVITGCVFLVLLFGVPQLVYANYIKVLKLFGSPKAAPKTSEEDSRQYSPLQAKDGAE